MVGDRPTQWVGFLPNYAGWIRTHFVATSLSGRSSAAEAMRFLELFAEQGDHAFFGDDFSLLD